MVQPIEYGCVDCGWRGENPPMRTMTTHRGPGTDRFTEHYCPRCHFSLCLASQIDWSRVTERKPEEPLC